MKLGRLLDPTLIRDMKRIPDPRVRVKDNSADSVNLRDRLIKLDRIRPV